MGVALYSEACTFSECIILRLTVWEATLLFGSHFQVSTCCLCKFLGLYSRGWESSRSCKLVCAQGTPSSAKVGYEGTSFFPR